MFKAVEACKPGQTFEIPLIAKATNETQVTQAENRLFDLLKIKLSINFGNLGIAVAIIVASVMIGLVATIGLFTELFKTM